MKDTSFLKKGFLASAILSTAFMLSACGGGGSSAVSANGTTNSGGSGTPIPTTNTGTSYLVFYGLNNGLWFVNPSDPTNPIQISNSQIDSTLYLTNVQTNPSTYSYSNLVGTELFYTTGYCNIIGTGSGGPIMAVSTVIGSSTIPVQVSSLTDACNIINSYQTAGVTYLLVSDINHNEYLISSNMTSSDNPIQLNNNTIVTSIGVPFQNSVSGFLIHNNDNNTIQECNITLSSCTTIGSGTNILYYASNPINGDSYMCVDGSLYVFSNSSNSLINTGATCSNYTYQPLYPIDNQGLYVVVYDNTGTTSIERYNYGSSSFQTIYSSSYHIESTAMTNNYLLVSTSNPSNSNYSILAIAKNGSSSNTIYSGTNLSYIQLFSSSNEVFINLVGQGSSTSACIWIEGSSTLSCTPNAYWLGPDYASSGTFNISADTMTLYKMLEYNSGSLYAVDPNSLSAYQLGNVPQNVFIHGFGIGNNILLTGFTPFTNSSTNYIFFANTSQANSLITSYTSNQFLEPIVPGEIGLE